ncbi:MAG: MSMEG_4193 family putative phosphomutase [Actinomycetes bacterium]
MATALLIRHGRTTTNASGTLAGWTPDVHLDEVGLEQVSALAARIIAVPMVAVVTSPLDRCRETAAAVVGDREIAVHPDAEVAEVRYGDWTGEPLKTLAKDPLWKVVQQHPSNARFPGDDAESLAEMQARAVRAIRGWNARLGADAVYAVVSHGDVIKAVLADALGLHLDLFQRIVVDPASLSVVRYSETRPFVERMNDSGGDIAGLLPSKRRRRSKSADAAVGGGAGPAQPKRRKR